MSNPASSSSHCICTCCLAEFAVLVNVLMNLRQETWNEEPLQLKRLLLWRRPRMLTDFTFPLTAAVT